VEWKIGSLAGCERMIESRFWKERLHRIAGQIRRVSKPPRWTERAHCTVEMDLMIGFFMVRRLIELHKVSSRVSDFRMEIYSCPNVGEDVTLLNRGCLDQLYQLENERVEVKKPWYVANQFIHAYLSFVATDETRNWWSVYIVSDFDRNDCVWRVPTQTIRELFLMVSREDPSSMTSTYNPQKRDYDVSVR
jgi:hypothetical protein